MVEELFEKTFGKILPFAEYEHVKDAPGETTNIRVSLPFYNLDTEENIVITAIFDEEKKLFQLNDMGFCSSKIETPDKDTLKYNKYFIRSGGFLFDKSAEGNYFFVLTPVANYDSEDVNLPKLIGHYITVLLSYNS